MEGSVRYSEAFKQQVLRELEERKFENHAQVQRAYGIRGAETIKGWILKYGKMNLLRRVIRVEKPEERNELKALRQRVRELEKGLADAHLDLKLEQAYTRLACRVAGIGDVEGFKKKHGGKP